MYCVPCCVNTHCARLGLIVVVDSAIHLRSCRTGLTMADPPPPPPTSSSSSSTHPPPPPPPRRVSPPIPPSFPPRPPLETPEPFFRPAAATPSHTPLGFPDMPTSLEPAAAATAAVKVTPVDDSGDSSQQEWSQWCSGDGGKKHGGPKIAYGQDGQPLNSGIDWNAWNKRGYSETRRDTQCEYVGTYPARPESKAGEWKNSVLSGKQKAKASTALQLSQSTQARNRHIECIGTFSA